MRATGLGLDGDSLRVYERKALKSVASVKDCALPCHAGSLLIMAGKMKYTSAASHILIGEESGRQRSVESSAGLRTVREYDERTCIDCLSYLSTYLAEMLSCFIHSRKDGTLGTVGGSAAGSPCPI